MMINSEKIIRELLEFADIHVNGLNPWDIQVHDKRFFDCVLTHSSLGLGEAYMDGWWDCESIDALITRVMLVDLREKVQNKGQLAFRLLKARLFNRQSKARVFEVGERHYDLGNDLYQAMLDKRMNYTCAYWGSAKTLDEAQEAKLDLVCQKIGLKPGMKILDIGCGWGSFARYAAEKYDASVVGVTISKEQVKLGMEMSRGLPVELRLQDYREVEGQFDAVVSIGVMEHIGHKNYRTYMEVANRCLKKGGIAFIHTIGSNLSITTGDPWSDKYIFPNAVLPSIAQLGRAMEGIFVMEDWHNIGPHYDRTLMAWHKNFNQSWDQLQSNYDERFRRMWNYYLLSSAGGFRSRHMQLWQIVLTRKGMTQPNCRFS